jgi:hypothetical protein
MQKKHLLSSALLTVALLNTKAQSQNWWRTNGNTPASTDVFGTTNAQPINIVTNNVLKMVIDANGNLRLVNFAGTGTRLVTTDANGNFLALPQGTVGQFLSSNGTWAALPASANVWAVNGSTVTNSNAGQVNINPNFIVNSNGSYKSNAFAGTSNRLLQTDATGNVTPFANGNTNDVLFGNGTWGPIPTPTIAGVWNVSGSNVYRNGFVGINKTNPTAALDINGDLKVSNNLYVGGGIVITDAIKADTVHMGAGRMIQGNTQVNGDITTTGNITLVPTRTLVAGGDIIAQSKLTVSGNATFNGVLRSTNMAGNGIGVVYADALGNLIKAAPGNGNTQVSSQPCIPFTAPWFEGGNNIPADNSIGTCSQHDFILKANSINSIFLKTTGSIGFGTNNPTEKFHFAGGNMLVGNHLLIGSPGPVDDINVSLNILQNGMEGIRFTSVSNGRKAYEIKYSVTPNNSNFLIYGSGQTRIGAIDGITYQYNVNNAMLTIAQAVKANKALSLVDNTNVSSTQSFFNVYGSGYTEIIANTPIATSDVFAIMDANNSNTVNFKIKKNGNTQIGNKTSVLHPNAELMVNGTIVAKELYITKPADWPDFVFKSDYNLLPLNKVEEFYLKEKHLPGVPSEKELEKTDINMAEMNKVLLQKIEELTLYAVEQNKQLTKLKNEVLILKGK